MLLPPYRTLHEPFPQRPNVAHDHCSFCAFRAALRSVRLRTLLVTVAVASSVVLNVSGALAAAYSAHLATQTIALTLDVVNAAMERQDEKLHEPPPLQPVAAVAPPPTPAPPVVQKPSFQEPSSCVAPGVMRGAGLNEFSIDRSVIDHLLEHIAAAMPQTRITPEHGRGELSGIRLTQVSRTSELVALGFEEGDVVWTINGFDMTNPEKALEAYTRLRTTDVIEIMLSRKGVLRIHRYHVVC